MDIPTGWELKGNALVREFQFADFAVAIDFINSVARIAQEQNHHPEIWNSYATVRLNLSTHDAGDVVTEKDVVLAVAINSLQ